MDKVEILEDVSKNILKHSERPDTTDTDLTMPSCQLPPGTPNVPRAVQPENSVRTTVSYPATRQHMPLTPILPFEKNGRFYTSEYF